MDRLNTVRRHPKSGKTKNVVLLLHGLGDSGAGLIGLADIFCEALPDTLFVAAAAPFSCPHVPFGYQWFDFPDQGGISNEMSFDQVMQSTRLVLSLIANEVAAANVDPGRMAVFGFSQGAMMALNAVPRMLSPVACAVGCSGGFLNVGPLQAIALAKPPVLLVHGDSDEIIPVALFHETARHLKEAGFEVQSKLMHAVGHQIPPEAVEVILEFMKERLGC